MKKLVSVEEVNNEGLVGLLGEMVVLLCCRYVYHGKLIGVNDTFVKLEDAELVYDTGTLVGDSWSSCEAPPSKDWYVQTASIESFGLSNRKPLKDRKAKK